MKRSVNPELAKIGWIGTGVMGRWMCQHLLDAGHDMSVFTRTAFKAQGLIDAGAHYCHSPAEVAKRSDVVFSIVGFPKDVEQVLLGPTGALSHLKKGAVLVDMTTSSPSLARRIAGMGATAGVHVLDAPVSGGDVGARNAALSIMVGGPRAGFEAVEGALRCMGTNIRYMGEAGSGQHTKMANQILIANNMIGACEALLYAQKAGLDLTEMIEAVATGAAGSWSIINLGPRIVKRDFDPGFYVEHFVKDMGIALEECEKMGIRLPGLELSHSLYSALRDEVEGGARMGTQALQLVLERANAKR